MIRIKTDAMNFVAYEVANKKQNHLTSIPYICGVWVKSGNHINTLTVDATQLQVL